MQQSWSAFTVEIEKSDPSSVLNLYTAALALRAQHLTGAGVIAWLESPSHGAMREGLLAFRRGSITVYMNLSGQDYAVEVEGQTIITSSGDFTASHIVRVVPACSTMWILN